ncbi:hypothetical protein TNIN_298571 [Trichonephila inaurata madagascariensis]|uniref:Uncharacterized protein n=1 Tax=Trichonephila inaurata madagascariensis TaxID=2747483 RepID=A0A8X6Y6Y0_9ARAC|nr:hypothetical protein TNIN_298571 [Trichonephila inaurata madagascariensis]
MILLEKPSEPTNITRSCVPFYCAARQHQPLPRDALEIVTSFSELAAQVTACLRQVAKFGICSLKLCWRADVGVTCNKASPTLLCVRTQPFSGKGSCRDTSRYPQIA